MTDQLKITVIATGFDSEDLRTKYGITTPAEKKQKSESDEKIRENEKTDKPKQEPGWPKDNFDQEDGTQFDIPAFMRGR
jgi:cell division protein FtsZ